MAKKKNRSAGGIIVGFLFVLIMVAAILNAPPAKKETVLPQPSLCKHVFNKMNLSNQYYFQDNNFSWGCTLDRVNKRFTCDNNNHTEIYCNMTI